MGKKRFLTYWIIFIIISLSVAPAFSLGERDENRILIGVMGLSPLAILFNLNKIYKEDLFLGVFCILLLIIPNISHPERMRWSTVLYTEMFCMNFLGFIHLLRSGVMSPRLYERILKYILFAYFVILLIQQACVLTGLPIINIRNYNLASPWKLNSLSAEPSHTARIIILISYSWIVMREFITGKKYDLFVNLRKDKWVWISILYPLLTMGSGTAFTLLPILALKLLSRKNIVRTGIVIMMSIVALSLFDIPQMERSKRFILATMSLNIDEINEADGSAAYRIVPMIVCAERVEVLSSDGLFGKGIDYTSTFMSRYLMAAPKNWTGGGVMSFWLEYGIILFIMYIYFSFKVTIIKNEPVSWLIWGGLVFLAAINSQMVWLTMTLMYANRYFLYKKSNLPSNMVSARMNSNRNGKLIDTIDRPL